MIGYMGMQLLVNFKTCFSLLFCVDVWFCLHVVFIGVAFCFVSPLTLNACFKLICTNAQALCIYVTKVTYRL